MTFIQDLVYAGDRLALLFLIGLLCFIGNKMVHSQPTMETCGSRIAIGVFLLSAVLLTLEAEPVGAMELACVVLASLAAAGLILGPAWMALAVLGRMYGFYRRAADAARRAADQRRNNRQEKQREKRRHLEQAQWEHQAPHREREANQAERQRLLDATKKAEEDQRREDARVACELLYDLREPDIGSRFAREKLDQFLGKYMDDGKPVEVVERWASELQLLIHQHYEVIKPSVKFSNLAQLTAWYEQQKSQVHDLTINELYKPDLLVRLNERYSELMERVLDAM